MNKKEHLKFIALILGLAVCVSFIFGGTLLSLTFNSEDVEKYVFLFINEERANRGLPILGNDTQLGLISKGWADSMVQTGILEHGDFQSRLKTIGYAGVYSCGEIIENFSSPVFVTVDLEMYTNPASAVARELVDGWLNSPPHKEIMLSPEGGDMGVAISRRGLVSYFGVVDFKFT